MGLYAGIDLHSNNSYLAIQDEDGKRVFKKRLVNDFSVIEQVLSPYRSDLRGVVVESTYNWYWLVDRLMDSDYRVHLANTSGMQRYKDLKHKCDRDDAYWLGEMLRLGILPEGHIYPKQERPVRDLLRYRSYLVKHRTSLILNLQNIIIRNYGINIKSKAIKKVKENMVSPLFESSDELAMLGEASKDLIDLFTFKIKSVEKAVLKKGKLKESYKYLLSIPGVGDVLSLTIMLETGSITRFNKVGNYASYCRKVNTKWISNEKKKGKGNKKNGNKYLSWAFSEAAEFSKRFDPRCRSYYDRKMRKTNFMVAHNALAHKLARAAYYIMRDQVPFDPDKLFS